MTAGLDAVRGLAPNRFVVLFIKGEQTNAIPRELPAMYPWRPFNPWPSVLTALLGIVLGVPFIVLGRTLTTGRLRRMFLHGNV